MFYICSIYVRITDWINGWTMKLTGFFKDLAAFGLFALGTYAWLVVA